MSSEEKTKTKLKIKGKKNPVKKPSSRFRIPVRVKILTGVFLLLSLAIGTILSYSTELILTDKKAYIFETGLQRTLSMANSFKTNFDKILERITSTSMNDETITPEYFFNFLGNNVFFYQRISPLEGSSDKQINGNFFTRPGIKLKYKPQDFENLDLSTLKFKKNKKLSIVDITSRTKFPSFAIIINDTENEVTNIIGVGAVEISSELKSADSFKYEVIGEKGRSFFSKKPSPFFNQIKSQNADTGTITATEDSGAELLLSYTKIPSLGLIFASSIYKQQAFKITEALFKRTLYFGLALLFLFFIFGTLFSITITKPVKLLSLATNKIAEGDFTHKVQVTTRDEFSQLGQSFNFMSGEIQSLLKTKEEMIEQLNEANLKLEDYSKNLEKMVAERTKELKEAHSFLSAMVNSLDQGLVVFDENIQCNNVYTQAAEKLFNNNPEGLAFSTLLGIEDEDEVEKVKKWADVAFKELIPFKSTLMLGPKEVVRGQDFNDPNFQHIDLNYYPMRNEDNKIENIVAVATDKTAEVIAQENFKKQESYVKMVLKLTNNKDHFLSFLDEVSKILASTNENIASAKDDPSTLNIEGLMINFHTLNGGFGLFSVDAIQKMARACEQTLIDMRKEEKSMEEIHRAATEMTMNLEIIIDDFKSSCSKIFGKKLTELYSNKEVPIKLIEDFYKVLSDAKVDEIAKNFKKQFINIPGKKFIEGYSDLISTLAQKLNKNVNPLKIEDHGMTLPPGSYKDFFNSLVHLFRNCMDHGLESNEKREENNKPKMGTIAVEFKTFHDDENDWMCVHVSDDGNGINPEIIRTKISEKKPEEDFSSVSDEDIIYNIFAPEFSTAEAVTEVSGRGVGMSAIKEVVDKYNGKIKIKSKVGVGSEFVFMLPLLS